MKNYLRGTPQARLARLSEHREGSDCIWFAGSKDADGYGRFFMAGKYPLAHRAAYEIHIGPIPEGQQVLHKCDNPSCVNPEHFFLGTQLDNIRDMVQKNRQRGVKGVKHHKAKLNPEKVFEIRWYAAMGRKHKEIAAEYSVTRALVSMIVRNEIWQQEIHD